MIDLPEWWKYIGGSDVGAVLGLPGLYRGQSAASLQARILGDEPPVDSDSAEKSAGRALERAVIEATVSWLGVGAGCWGTPKAQIHNHWARSSPDAEVTVGGKSVVIEAKAVGQHARHMWGHGGAWVPPAYLAQVLWYQYWGNYREAVIGVLIGGQDFRFYRVGDMCDAASLVNAVSWWHQRHILQRVPVVARVAVAQPVQRAAHVDLPEMVDGVVRARRNLDAATAEFQAARADAIATLESMGVAEATGNEGVLKWDKKSLRIQPKKPQ